MPVSNRGKEIIGRFGSLKSHYITPEPNKPFQDFEMREIKEMLDDIDWRGRLPEADEKEIKEALGFSSYQKALTGDYSEFERIHPVLRNYHAMRSEQMYRSTLEDIEAWRTDPSHVYGDNLINLRLQHLIYDPAVRLGMSIMQNDGTGKYSFYRTLDDRMIDLIMEDTLNPMTQSQINSVYEMTNGPEEFQAAIDTNVEKQVQVAKMMLMAHMGNTKLMKDGQPAEMDRSVASMMTHCSRTAFVFPPGETKEVAAMMGHLTGAQKGKGAGIYGRFAATHSTAHGKTIGEFKEKKTVSFRHQYGMDIAIGGLGNGGIPGKDRVQQMLKNDGTCGHMYMRVDQGGKDKTSSLLIGFESDSPSAIGNQQGHTHTASAAPEYMSSFLGQRTDEMGAKYGGRIVDCTAYSPQELSEIVEKFTAQYRGMVREAMNNPEARKRLEQANKMLSGKLMDAPQMETFFNKSGFSMEEAQKYTQMAADKKGMAYQMNAKQVGEPAVHPINEVPKPGKRNRIRAFFGSSDAKQKIQEFQAYQKQKQEMDAKAAHELMTELANQKSREEYERSEERRKIAEQLIAKREKAEMEYNHWANEERKRVSELKTTEYKAKESMSMAELVHEELSAKPKRQRPDFKQVRNAFKMDRAMDRIMEAENEQREFKKGPSKK